MADHDEQIAAFWDRKMEEINEMDKAIFRQPHHNQELPLARIKKIMKLDEDVKMQMISAEVPVLLAKASELFIEELTTRAWLHTDENKRKTLQKNDVAAAAARNDQFDFLLDIVPRDEIRISASTNGLNNSSSSAGNLATPRRTQTSTHPAQQQQQQAMPQVIQVQSPESLMRLLQGVTTVNGISGVSPFAQQNGQVVQIVNSNQLQALSNTGGGQQIQLIQLPADQAQSMQTSAGQTVQLQQIMAHHQQPTTSSAVNQVQQVVQQQQQHQQVMDSAADDSGGEDEEALPQLFERIVLPDGTVQHVPVTFPAEQMRQLRHIIKQQPRAGGSISAGGGGPSSNTVVDVSSSHHHQPGMGHQQATLVVTPAVTTQAQATTTGGGSGSTQQMTLVQAKSETGKTSSSGRFRVVTATPQQNSGRTQRFAQSVRPATQSSGSTNAQPASNVVYIMSQSKDGQS